MALTRDVRETFVEAAKKSPKYRVALLGAAAECFIKGEPGVAKDLLRDYVEATIGLNKTAKLLDRKPETVARMFSNCGKMSSDTTVKLLSSFYKREGVEPQFKINGK